MKTMIFAEALKAMEEGAVCTHHLEGITNHYRMESDILTTKTDMGWMATKLSARVFLQGHWELSKMISKKRMKLRAYVSEDDGQIQWRVDGTKMDFFTATDWVKEVELI